MDELQKVDAQFPQPRTRAFVSNDVPKMRREIDALRSQRAAQNEKARRKAVEQRLSKALKMYDRLEHAAISVIHFSQTFAHNIQDCHLQYVVREARCEEHLEDLDSAEQGIELARKKWAKR